MKMMLKVLIAILILPNVAMAQHPSESNASGYKLLDFKPLNDCILTLNQQEATFYLGIDSAGQQIERYVIDVENPGSIYFDCMNAPYLLNNEYAYQFVLAENKFSVVTRMTRQRFDLGVKPCVASIDDRIFYESFQPVTSLYQIDLMNDSVTNTVFNRAVRLDAYETSITNNSARETDTWNGFQRSLAHQNRAMDSENQRAYQTSDMSSLDQALPVNPGLSYPSPTGNSVKYIRYTRKEPYTSTQISIKPLVQSEQIGDFIVVMDYGADSVYVLDHFGYEVSAKPFQVSGVWKGVLADVGTGNMYICTAEDGEESIYRLDPFTGSMLHVLDLDSDMKFYEMECYNDQLHYPIRDAKGVSIESIDLQ